MLLTIHNLPARTQYDDVKEMIISKCGLKELILDNLVNEGGGMRVTVGVMEEEDAAILVRKVNGIYFGGHQLYVENKRQKRESDQPYRSSMAPPAQQQYLPQAQGQASYDYPQVQNVPVWPTSQPLANHMFQPQPAAQAVQNAYMAYGQQQQYPKILMSQYTGTLNEYGQGYGQLVSEQTPNDQQGYDRQEYEQQGYDQLGYIQQTYNQQGSKAPEDDNLYARRSAPIQELNKAGAQWGETVPDRNERRRPASPRAWDQNQLAPKRPKWDQSDRPDRSFDRREDRGFKSRGVGRSRPGPSRWDQPSDRHDERRDRRDQIDRRDPIDRRDQIDRRDPIDRREPIDRRDQTDWRGQAHSRDQTNRRDQVDWRDQTDRRDQTFRHDQTERRDQSAWRGQADRREQPNARELPLKTEPEWKKRAPAAAKSIDEVKFNKMRAMRLLMFDTVKSLNAEVALRGPSVLKSTLRKVIITRIDQLDGTQFVEAEGIVALYRNTYPESSDRPMFDNLKRNVEEVGDMSGANKSAVYYASKYLSGGPGRQPAPGGPGAGAGPGPGPARRPAPWPFVNRKDYKQAIFSLLCPIFTEVARNLNLPSQLEPSLFKSVLRGILSERIGDILKDKPVGMEDAVAHYRLKYPAEDDLVTYAKVMAKINETKVMKVNDIKEFATTFIVDPSPVVLSFMLPKPQPAGNRFQDGVLNKPSGSRFQDSVPNKPAGNRFQDGATNKPAGNRFQDGVLNKPSGSRFQDGVPNKPAGNRFQDGAPNKPAGNRFQDGVPNKPAGSRFQDSVPNRPAENRFQDGILNKPSGSRFQDGVPNKPAGSKAPFVPPPGKIPSYPQGDKKMHSKMKQLSKKERLAMERYAASPALQRALDAEVIAVGRLIEKEFKQPRSDVEKTIYHKINKIECISECTKFLLHHLSKRITNEGQKVARIYSHPKPPNRTDLQNYLARFNCLAVRKSVKNAFYTATFDSYDTIDRLCDMGPVHIGYDKVSITVKHMHVGPIKPKYSQKHWKTLRKKYIQSLIDHSRVNLLERDWPEQEENERKARAARDAENDDDANDVILVEDDDIKTVDITEEANKTFDTDDTVVLNTDDVNDNKDSVHDNKDSFNVNNDTTNDHSDSINDKNDVIKVDNDDANVNNDSTDDNKDTSVKNETNDQDFLHEDFKVIDEVRESDNDDEYKGLDEENGNQIDDDWDQTGDDWGDGICADDNDEIVPVIDENAQAEDAAVEEIAMQDAAANDSGSVNSKVVDVGDDDDDEIGGNAEDIDIADVDWDDVDEDDLVDY